MTTFPTKMAKIVGQVDDRGMRDGVHTIRYSCYHREKGTEET